MKLRRKLICAASAALMLFSGAGLLPGEMPSVSRPIVAEAASFTVNSTDVRLYAVQPDQKDYITIPSKYKKKFQLSVSGASDVSYSVLYYGDNGPVKVSSSGLITVSPQTQYQYRKDGYIWTYSTPQPGLELYRKISKVIFGTFTVRVSSGSEYVDVSVQVNDYSSVFVDNKLKTFVKETLSPLNDDKQKITEIAKYIAGYDYDYHYYTYRDMLIFGGGDCWASTGLACELARRAGMEAWERAGNMDLGAGSGHKNAMVKTADGRYFEVEAGYSGTAPRSYRVTERTSLFSYHYNTALEGKHIYQYDGFGDTVLDVPAKLDGEPVVSIGSNCFNRNSSNYSPVSIHLPDTVKEIGSGAFFGRESLTEVNIPEGCTKLGEYAFGNNGMTSITVPSSVTEIGAYAFGFDKISDQPQKIESFTVYCEPGSAAWEYAGENGLARIAPPTPGDIDRNGSIDSIDLELFTVYITGGSDTPDIAVGDLNDDRSIDLRDYALLKRKLRDAKKEI